jgi:hypothetical protein
VRALSRIAAVAVAAAALYFAGIVNSIILSHPGRRGRWLPTVGIICLVIAWRTRRSSPELGAILAVVPLFFAWRSLFSYFFLLPLFALAAIARMPLGELAFERARKLGGLTIFAAPSRS